MTVIDIATGEPLTRDQIEIRESAASPERAAREALTDAFALIKQLRSGTTGDYTRAIDHALQALAHACSANGLDPLALACKMTPIGDAS